MRDCVTTELQTRFVSGLTLKITDQVADLSLIQWIEQSVWHHGDFGPLSANDFIARNDQSIRRVNNCYRLFVFVFDRTVSLRRGQVIPGPFVRRFLQQLGEGSLERDAALDLCDDNASHISTVFAAAIRKWGRPAVEVEQAILKRRQDQLRRLYEYAVRRSQIQLSLGID